MLYEKLHRIEQITFDAMALFLVLFYSYSSVFEPAATQYTTAVSTLSSPTYWCSCSIAHPLSGAEYGTTY